MPASLTEIEISSFISLDIIEMIESTVVLEINVFSVCTVMLELVGFVLQTFFDNIFQMTL